VRDIPLTAVRSFCAAAENMSFKVAAEQLHVTPGAVSQQVKQLEDWFGLKLFERKTRGVALTEAGIDFYAASHKALRQLSAAALAIRPEEKSVRVTTVPSFATRWLVPRLADFAKLHPSIDVSIDASDDLHDLDQGDVDLAIRIVREVPPPQLHSVKLFDEVWFPVCSPAYKKAHVKAGVIQASARLVHEVSYSRANTWEQWLTKYGAAQGVMPKKGVYFSLEMLGYQAAIQGQGLVLGNQHLLERELADGTLVIAVNKPLNLGYAYYLVWSKQLARVNNSKGSVQDLRRWLLTMCA
jgi:LysR family transcriptional regulator, glycine cleavage system transcriptional activator